MTTLQYTPPATVKDFGARLRELLSYDPLTGIFIWRKRSAALGVAVVAGGRTTDGQYISISIDGKAYLAHRLAWFWMTGAWPENLIDHENTCGLDNRWRNLRPATKKQNACNARAHRDSRSGVKGVTWNAKAQKWQAQVYHEGRQHYLGVFTELPDATQVAAAKRAELHGEFARAA